MEESLEKIQPVANDKICETAERRTDRGGNDWSPTENQIGVLDYCQDRDYDYKVKDLAEKIGINRKTFHKWFDTSVFVTWWNEQFEKYMARQLPKITSALVKEATGNAPMGRSCAPAAKLIFERWDKQYVPKSKQDINIKGNLQIGVGNEKLDFILDEVIKRCAALDGGQRAIEENPDQGDSERAGSMD